MEKYDNLENIKDNLNNDLNENNYNIEKLHYSNNPVLEKIILMKLIGNYKKNSRISTDVKVLEELEEKIYSQINIKNDIDKILFELKRIKSKISSKKIVDEKILEEYENMIEIYNIYKNYLKNESTLLEEIYECIIILELKLGIQIALFKELFNLVENKYSDYIINNKIRKLDFEDEHRNFSNR